MGPRGCRTGTHHLCTVPQGIALLRRWRMWGLRGLATGRQHPVLHRIVPYPAVQVHHRLLPALEELLVGGS